VPIYSFRCRGCAWGGTRILKYDERDLPGPCPRCGGTLERAPVESFSVPKVKPQTVLVRRPQPKGLDVTFQGMTLEGAKCGISLKGGKLTTRDMRFSRCKTAIRAENTDVDIEDTEIE